MIPSEDVIELSRLERLLHIALDSGDDDLFLRQCINDQIILLTKMQNSLGIVATAGSLMGLT